MAHNQITTNLTSLLFSFMNQPDPMLSMLGWLCQQMMEAEVTFKLNAEKANGLIRAPDTVPATVHADWIPVWALFI